MERYDEWQSTEKENKTRIKSKCIYSAAYVTSRSECAASIFGIKCSISFAASYSSHSELFVQLVCIVMKLNWVSWARPPVKGLDAEPRHHNVNTFLSLLTSSWYLKRAKASLMLQWRKFELTLGVNTRNCNDSSVAQATEVIFVLAQKISVAFSRTKQKHSQTCLRFRTDSITWRPRSPATETASQLMGEQCDMKC